MKISCLVCIFFLCLTADEVLSRSLPTPVRTRTEIITVRDSVHGFISEVTELNYSTPSRDYYIPYHSLETIKKINISLIDATGKQSRIKEPQLEDIQIPSSVFYSCLRSKLITLPEKVSFQVRYSRECRDLLLLSGLVFSSSMPVDTFYYEVRIPSELHLAYDLPFPGMLSCFKVDTVIGPKVTVYRITAVPRLKIAGNFIHMQPDKSIRRKACMLRLIITPVQFAGREKDYFGMRMQSMISAASVIPDSLKGMLDSICGQNHAPDSVTARALSFVAKKIKYLDVEVGYGSFVPVEIGLVIRERQADCKGKSNLLCQVLRSRGLEAYLAMASTADFSRDMDFPSLSSGNHMVCVLKRGDSWVFLDPTDENCLPGRVSISIQGRTVFIFGRDEFTFVKVPVEPGELNQEEFSFNLSVSNGQVSGQMSYKATGVPSELLEEATRLQEDRKEILGEEFVRYRVPNSLPSHPHFIGGVDSLSFDCTIHFGPSVLVATKSVLYLSMGFLPLPSRFPKQSTDGCDIIRVCASRLKVHASVDAGSISEAVLFEPRKFAEGPFTMQLECRREKGLIFLDYLFTCNTNLVKEEDLPVYSRFESFCDNAFRQVIRFK